MGKSDANECNESLLSNCRVQLALSKKKDGMILEQYLYDEKAYCLKEQYDGTDCSDSMVPIPLLLLISAPSCHYPQTSHFRFPQKKTDKLLYIDASLDGILSARVSKLMTTDNPIFI